MSKAKIVVISGPSGVGKGTVHAALRASSADYDLSVSVTTRPPREGEVDGVHYYFRTQEVFDRLVQEGQFVEYACRYNNRYGTLRSELQRIVDSGKHVLLDIEYDGAINIKKAFPEAVLIFLLPPSLDDLYVRIKGRGSETEDTLRARFSQAVDEMEQYAKQYDYIMVNENVEECVKRINEIVRAEQMRVQDNLQLIEYLKGGKRIC